MPASAVLTLPDRLRLAAMADDVQLKLYDDHVDLVAPEFDIRFKSLRAFRRFRDWVETARIVGDELGRPPQTKLSEDGGDEWYALATPEGDVVLHHFSDGEVEMAVTMPAEGWREIGHVVLGTSGVI